MKTTVLFQSLLVASFLHLSTPIAQAAEPVTMPNTTVPNEPPTMQPPVSDQMGVKGTLKLSKVSFVEPKDGATVPPKFKVVMAVEGMKVAPAGMMTAGTGHHHLIIDGQAIAKGKLIPFDANHIHLVKSETQTELTLKPGAHTLTLQFGDGSHMSYGEMMSQTIKITVK